MLSVKKSFSRSNPITNNNVFELIITIVKLDKIYKKRLFYHLLVLKLQTGNINMTDLLKLLN